MTTDQPRTPATVVVHCGDIDGGRLERRLRTVLDTLPAHARVIATALGRRRLSPLAAQRVRVVVVRDGGASLLEEQVGEQQDVVVLPPGAQVGAGWFDVVVQRLRDEPGAVGVLPLGGHHVFAYPAAVTDLGAARVEWTPVAGLSARTGAGPTAGRPTLGAVLIVKDEEAGLGQCLAALRGVVDEVVVYDTGSTDATVEIARSSGAVVVEGYWDSDFSAARNRALACSTADWVLSVDADEVLMTDRRELHRWLAGARGEAALVRITSLTTAGGTDGDDLRAVRLFRRSAARWAGALHEQVVPVSGAPRWAPCATPPPLHLVHSGYTLGHERAAEKATRNLTVAQSARERLVEDTPEWAEATVAYARSLGQAGRHDECIEVLRLVADREVTDGNVVQAARGVVPLLLQRGLLDEALRWTERAAGAGEAPGLTALRTALVRFGRGGHLAALADLERLVAGGAAAGGCDLWERPFDVDIAAVALADLQTGAGQSHAAATSMVRLMVSAPHKVPVATLLTAVLTAGGDLVELAEHAPDAFVERSLREAPVAVPDLAIAWAAALATTHPADPRPLVAGSVLAARTSVEVALEWSVKVREAGLPELCPLRTIGADTTLHPRARLLALGLLHHGLGDGHLDDEARRLVVSVGEADRGDVVVELRRYVPEAPSLVGAPA